MSNSMTELYTMMKYLQGDILEKNGLTNFDAWASNFGETTTEMELAPEGNGYRAKTRFAKFFNLPELMNMTTSGCLTAKRHFKIINNLELINQLLVDGEKAQNNIKFMYAEEYSKSNEYRKKKCNKSENQQFQNEIVDENNIQNSNRDERTLSTVSKGNVRQCQKGTVDSAKRERKSISNKSISNKSLLKSINPSKENPQNQRNLKTKKEKIDMIDTIDFQYTMEAVKEQIFYESILDEYPSEKETVDCILNILTEIKISKKKTVRVNGENLSISIVQDVLSSVDMLHIQYVLDSLKKNTTEIKNMKAYLTTSLYNAPLTYEAHIQVQVNHHTSQPYFYKPVEHKPQDSPVAIPEVPPIPTQAIQSEEESLDTSTKTVIEPNIPKDSLVTSTTEQQSITKENISVPQTSTQTVIEETAIEEIPEVILRKLATITLLISDLNLKDQEKKKEFIKQLDRDIPNWRDLKNSNARRLQDKLLSA